MSRGELRPGPVVQSRPGFGAAGKVIEDNRKLKKIADCLIIVTQYIWIFFFIAPIQQ